MKRILFLYIIHLIICNSVAQEEIKLYPYGIKESNELNVAESYKDSTFLRNISDPRMYVFLASKEKANGTAVLICPGGAYGGVTFSFEGIDIAKWFNSLGVSAFVLYYRTPNGHCTIPLTDAQTAMGIIQKNARKWKIDKKKIGIIGFSAGGHLAATVGTHFKTAKQRPAFMILAYPVVTMNREFTHPGSRNNLLGKNPSEELVRYYSGELQVKKNTPPTYIVHAVNDKVAPVKNSIEFYTALKEMKIEARLDTFAIGGHGFGMKKRGMPIDSWSELLKDWLAKNNFISPDQL